MRLKNILIVVKDIEHSKQFYHDLFGLNTILDNDGNVILTEGLVLQDEKIWKEVLNKDIIPENHASELYFEEPDIEAFARKLEKLYPNIRYYRKDIWIIDVSQSVEIDHPNALHFLRNDCKNVTDYFSK